MTQEAVGGSLLEKNLEKISILSPAAPCPGGKGLRAQPQLGFLHAAVYLHISLLPSMFWKRKSCLVNTALLQWLLWCAADKVPTSSHV